MEEGKGLKTIAAISPVCDSCVVLAIIGEGGTHYPSFFLPPLLPSSIPSPLSFPSSKTGCCYGWVITFMQRAVKEYVLAVDAAYGKQFEEFTVGFEGR